MKSGNSDISERLRLALRALRHRNYRLFFVGQGISLIGTWMQNVATSWLVFRLTHSEMMLGLAAFAGQIPIAFLSPFAGVFGDRLDRRRMLIAVQVLAMTQALALAVFTITGTVRVWHVIALNLILGMVNAFEMPTRQAFVIQMIDDRSDLGNAIALNSSLFNASRLVGPAIAGLLVAAAGEGVCFAVNSVSYGGAIAAFAFMRIPRRASKRPRTGIFTELGEGIAYVARFTPIRDLIAIVGLTSLVAMAFPVLLPVFAGSILQGGSLTYGFLVASTGMGALAATLYLAMRESVLGLERVIATALVLFGAGLAAFSISRSFMLSMVILAIVGFVMISVTASCNTLIQTVVDEDKRGRVMSLYVMAFMGAAPLGSILAGSVSSAIGTPHTVLIGGCILMLGGVAFGRRLPAIRKVIRPIYKKMGIMPGAAAGVHAADEPPVP
ncbi:MAG: MFS transporter [Spirochaetes bacterium]|nr:MFS transporter [Spirochaetota bacterium]